MPSFSLTRTSWSSVNYPPECLNPNPMLNSVCCHDAPLAITGCNCGMQITSSKTLCYSLDKSWLYDFSFCRWVAMALSVHIHYCYYLLTFCHPFYFPLIYEAFLPKRKFGLQPDINTNCSSHIYINSKQQPNQTGQSPTFVSVSSWFKDTVVILLALPWSA